jgi:hypothetical protein
MKTTAKRTPTPVPASGPRGRRQEQPVLARCDVRMLRPEGPEGGEPRPVPADWEPPLLRGGGRWIGGSLRREEIYGDDGR